MKKNVEFEIQSNALHFQTESKTFFYKKSKEKKVKVIDDYHLSKWRREAINQ